jgi:HAD superfamily hydrolase (TIGR01509 family)
VFKVAQNDGGLPSQRANHIGRGVAALLDEAPGAVLGLLACLVVGSQQLFRDLFGAPCRDPGEGGRSLAQAFQVVFCAHTESVRPPPGDVQGQPDRGQDGPGSVDRMSGSPWKLVIFDNDGVVVDSEPLAEQAMSGALAAAGYPMTPEECGDAFRGATLVATRRIIEERSGRPLPPEFEDQYTTVLYELIRTQLRPVAGIEMVLDRLETAGVAYCLASSGRRDRVKFALETVGLLSRFGDHWWGAEDVTHGKPAPDLFLLAAEKMSTPPADCLVVEDAEFGVQAARAAGMAVFGFAAHTPAEKLAGADYVFKDMAELPGLILGSLILGSRPDGP